jgi:hypothetical protein
MKANQFKNVDMKHPTEQGDREQKF